MTTKLLLHRLITFCIFAQFQFVHKRTDTKLQHHNAQSFVLKAIHIFIPLHPFLQLRILRVYSIQHIIVGERIEHLISVD